MADISEYVEKIYSYDISLRRLIGSMISYDDVEDVLQNTYLAALKKIGNYRPDTPLVCWLRGIAKIEALKSRQKFARLRECSFNVMDDFLSEADLSFNFFDEESLHLKIYKGLEKLEQNQRRILMMKYFEGKKVCEIAKILGRTEGSVGMHLSRGRRNLKLILEEMGVNQWQF